MEEQNLADIAQKESASHRQGGGYRSNGVRRRYTPPRILSSEPLEIAATTCPNTNPSGPGKAAPPFCNGWGT
jgi:hypothetical protein